MSFAKPLAHDVPPPDGTGLIRIDPWLGPYAGALKHRYRNFTRLRDEIVAAEGSLADFSRGHERFGFVRGRNQGTQGTWYREWAPGAARLCLVGDFNGWKGDAHPMQRDEWGVWSVFVPDPAGGGEAIPHQSRVKVRVHATDGTVMDRIPAYIRRVVFEANGQNAAGQIWRPPAPYRWRHESPAVTRAPRIYEAHVGMAQEEAKVGTFAEFQERVLPRIARAGYNTLQLMAIQEHPYYGSFGYHVSNFFAVSSRFGTPDEFKSLVDAAHGHGVRVLLDLVHSHSVKNTVEGLNAFDGTDHQYFHAGGRGQHPHWDSLLFDYAKWEVLRFLASNVRFWLEEYRVDGFRFDGVTSMMYLHHGTKGFTSYDDYLINDIDEPAVTYLQIANEVAHAVRPDCVTIAEDVSGMVGLARRVDEGGLGFDFRLAMGLPDFWIRLLRDTRDEDWGMDELFRTLSNRRNGERHIAYAESHDQALVGDKTVAFWLMDKEMYWHMNAGSRNAIIDRGIALHKLIRLATFAAGGEGYLTFIGNEFGHAEWVDFPREGNNWSYKHARRQWSLVDNPDLRYKDLSAFDRAMMELDQKFDVLQAGFAEWIGVHEERKLLFFARRGLVFLFNFHPTESIKDWRVGVPERYDYKVVLSTDEPEFGGFGNARHGQIYPVQHQGEHNRPQSVMVYVPARSAQVLAPVRRA